MTSRANHASTTEALLKVWRARAGKRADPDRLVPLIAHGPTLYYAMTDREIGDRTMVGYVTAGRRGVHLEAIRVAGQRLISARMLAEFLAEVSQQPDGRRVPEKARRKGTKVSAKNRRARKTCPKGHDYDKHNTYRDPRGARQCRRCNAEAQERRRGR